MYVVKKVTVNTFPHTLFIRILLDKLFAIETLGGLKYIGAINCVGSNIILGAQKSGNLEACLVRKPR